MGNMVLELVHEVEVFDMQQVTDIIGGIFSFLLHQVGQNIDALGVSHDQDPFFRLNRENFLVFHE